MKSFKAYKVFNPDWSCNNYSFAQNGTAIGTEHSIGGELKLCNNGFHFCRKLSMCFNYYTFSSDNKVAEVEILGDVVGDKEDKECTNKLRIIRELSWVEVLTLVNTGVGNSGHENSDNGTAATRE